MKCMNDYMEIYCMCDTLHLTEVFELYRQESINNFEIDPTPFISLPGCAYSAFLTKTNVSLEYYVVCMANYFSREMNYFPSQKLL